MLVHYKQKIIKPREDGILLLAFIDLMRKPFEGAILVNEKDCRLLSLRGG